MVEGANLPNGSFSNITVSIYAKLESRSDRSFGTQNDALSLDIEQDISIHHVA